MRTHEIDNPAQAYATLQVYLDLTEGVPPSYIHLPLLRFKPISSFPPFPPPVKLWHSVDLKPSHQLQMFYLTAQRTVDVPAGEGFCGQLMMFFSQGSIQCILPLAAEETVSLDRSPKSQAIA